MLCRLEVSNYALIENVDLTLEKGFTVITGETGAGKSILLKALQLLLGERSDSGVLKNSEKKCFLEATFDVSALKLESFFEEHELDFDKRCIVRREFSAAGKSRCFINDTPVQLNVLKALGENLISIHSQHETLSLFDTGFQFDVVDYFAGIQNDVNAYKKNYRHYKELLRQLEILEETEARNRKERDFKSFLLNELIDANLDKTNWNKLLEDYNQLQHHEKIRELISQSVQILENENHNPSRQLRLLVAAFDELKNINSSYTDIYTRLKSVQIELDDLSKEIENMSGGAEFSESESLIIREKIDLFQALLYKHNLQKAEQLIEVREKLKHELTEIESIENAVEQTKKEIGKLIAQLKKNAATISDKRKVEAKALEKTIRSILINLSMADAELHIDLSDSDELNPFGQNEIDFQFKTNRGGQFLPLKKIASGGEMSRLMLAILSTLAETKNLPVLIFDEIDTGVSGEVASRIASEFARMGKNLQLIAITHLPQVAARGTHHFHVAKEAEDNKTKTFIKKLTKKERIQELAKMISGEKVTDAAIENAENLLNFS